MAAYPEPADTVNRSAFCAMAGITPKIFDSWAAAGIPIVSRPEAKGGEWRISPSQVIQFLWNNRRKPTSLADEYQASRDPEALDLNLERARLARQQTLGHELKNAELRGELLPAAEVQAGWEAAIGRARSLLIGIATAQPTTLVMLARAHEQPDAERLIREKLRDAIDGALAELSNTRLDDVENDEAKPADEGGAS